MFNYLIQGEDAKHRLNELNFHGPTVKGWQSERNCSYPQEIILQLEKISKLHKIQVLAHQYLICKYNLLLIYCYLKLITAQNNFHFYIFI